MKKIIAAVAMIAPLGVVQAQSNIVIFGNLDAAVVSVGQSNGTTTAGGSTPTTPIARITRLDSGVGPGTRFGFRGSEDLGDGLRANFLLEAGFGIDTGASQQGGVLFGRQAYVGLSSLDWTLSAGRQYAPIDVVFATVDPQGGLYWGNPTTSTNHAVYPTIGAAPTSGTFQSTSRVNNSLQGTYTTKSGFTVKLMLAAGDENARGTGRLINPSINYTNGPLSLSASATRLRQAEGSILAGASPEWLSEQIVGGSYAFESAKVFAGVYQFIGSSNDANRSAGATVGSLSASPYAYAWRKQHSYWVGARIPVGRGIFIPSVARIDYLNENNHPDGKGTALALVYEYPLSKRTTLYANYGQVANNAFANGLLVSTITVLNANGYGTTLRAFALGMRHAF